MYLYLLFLAPHSGSGGGCGFDRILRMPHRLQRTRRPILRHCGVEVTSQTLQRYLVIFDAKRDIYNHTTSLRAANAICCFAAASASAATPGAGCMPAMGVAVMTEWLRTVSGRLGSAST